MKFKYLILLLFFYNDSLYADDAPWVGVDLKGAYCVGSAQGLGGPFDYTKHRIKEAKNLTNIENQHFTPLVENLISGKTGPLTDDLNKTLLSWPNHHRALLSLVRYQLKLNSKLIAEPIKTASPVECYFQRAINFSPKDATTISLYGYYLRKIGQLQEAAKAYDQASLLAPNNSKIEYAYSLLLIDLKKYDQALVHARNAYKYGKPPAGLKKKLVKLGAWK